MAAGPVDLEPRGGRDMPRATAASRAKRCAADAAAGATAGALLARAPAPLLGGRWRSVAGRTSAAEGKRAHKRSTGRRPNGAE
eukprot:8219604-Alexandrium_andersonii.AAC.1